MRNHRSLQLFRLSSIVALALASGCNAVLGIESAEVDPALGAGGSAGASSGSGGASSGSGGASSGSGGASSGSGGASSGSGGASSGNGGASSGNGGANPVAGAAGQGGASGTPCDRYCDDAVAHCKQDNAIYTSRGVCMQMCANFESGVEGETDKDSLACRAYHAKAAQGNPSIHCRHAGVIGGGVCGSEPCNAFCLQAFALCAGSSLGYVSEADCLSACKGKMEYLSGAGDGDLEYTTGDTLNCRLYHLQAAANPDVPTAKVVHCPHTKAVSPVCFDAGGAGAGGSGGAGSGGAGAWAGAGGQVAGSGGTP